MKLLRQHLIRVSLLFLASAFLIFFNPFKAEEATDSISRDFIYRAMSVAYPQTNRPKIFVSLITESAFGPGESWPLPIAKYAAFLEALLPLQPKAVMIDLAFIDERADQGLAFFTSVLGKYRTTGIPVYLVGATPSEGSPRPIRRDLSSLVASGLIRLVDAGLGEVHGGLAGYPIVSESSPYPPAALAIYHDICRARPGHACTEPKGKQFEVWWAAPPNLFNRRLFKHASAAAEPVSDNAYLRAANLLLKGALSGIVNLAIEQDPILPPFAPTALFEEVASGGLYSPGLSPLRQQAEGAVVFVGTHLALTHDNVYSPVYGFNSDREVPGVYQHAMAYDNLVARDGDVVKRANLFFDQNTPNLIAAAFVCCLVLLVARILWQWVMKKRAPMWLDGAALLSTAIGISIVQLLSFNLSPGNWLGVTAGVVAGGELIEWLGMLRKCVKRYFGFDSQTYSET
jgi:CHASE2 domain-containing sensor protein